MNRDSVTLHKRKSFTAKDRLRIFTAHGGRCYLSGAKIGPGDEWDVEHVISLAMGGTNEDENLRPALREAHRAKSSKETTERAKVNRIIRKSDPETRKPSRMKSRPFPKSGSKQKIPSRGWERKTK